MDRRLAMAWTVRGGRIVRVVAFDDLPQARRAFGLPPEAAPRPLQESKQ